ncbi:MAG: diacylglycerol/lipid kinase family protein [Anaerovoracaceae bacterium]|jgi:diacylglycerol kinase (ATP)
MKHIFILNPVAGHKKAEPKFLPQILEAVKAEGVDYEIHRTMNVGDGENFVRNRCVAYADEKLRFYAVGGDGTLNEVANGAFGCPHAEIAFIPAGTGNDFARNFADPKAFLDIKSQLRGSAKRIDLIQYGDKVIVNMLNIGLDCAVAAQLDIIKQKFFLRGPLAYIAGVGVVFAGNEGFDLKVTLEDGRVFDREFTLVAVGNGAFCGGGFMGVPRAKIDDGLLDVSLVNKVNRRTFASLITKYHKGTHLESPLAKEIITYVQCRSLTIEPKDTMQICVDGEVFHSGKLNISILPAAMNFSVPDIL